MFPFQKILCPTDFSEASLCGVKMAGEMAAKFNSEVILLNVHKPIPHLPAPRIETDEVNFDISLYEQKVIIHSEKALADMQTNILGGGIKTSLLVKIGSPARQILDTAEELDVDAIFIATHGRTGLSKIVFGSVAQRVVRRAKCPVLSIRACD